MDCLPIDDTCIIQNYYNRLNVVMQQKLYYQTNEFTLAEVRGKKYVYTWVDGVPTIYIINAPDDLDPTSQFLD